MPSVLFVCHANLCRSPLAEGIFLDLVRQRGLQEQYKIDSAGTYAAVGHPPHKLSIEVARHFGLELHGIARQLVKDDLSEFEEILVMDQHNLRELQTLASPSAFAPLEHFPARIRRLLEVGSSKDQHKSLDVPDPIGKPRSFFEKVYEEMRSSCVALLDELEASSNDSSPPG